MLRKPLPPARDTLDPLNSFEEESNWLISKSVLRGSTLRASPIR